MWDNKIVSIIKCKLDLNAILEDNSGGSNPALLFVNLFYQQPFVTSVTKTSMTGLLLFFVIRCALTHQQIWNSPIWACNSAIPYLAKIFGIHVRMRTCIFLFLRDTTELFRFRHGLHTFSTHLLPWWERRTGKRCCSIVNIIHGVNERRFAFVTK